MKSNKKEYYASQPVDNLDIYTELPIDKVHKKQSVSRKKYRMVAKSAK